MRGKWYYFRGTDYVITAAAYDGYGYNNLVALRKTLLLLFVVGLSLLFVVGYFLARSALKPIRDIVHDAEKISGSELDKRKHSNKCTFYSLRFGCSFAVANTIKPQLL